MTLFLLCALLLLVGFGYLRLYYKVCYYEAKLTDLNLPDGVKDLKWYKICH